MKLDSLFVGETENIKSVMHKIDVGGIGTAVVVDGERRLLGVVTTGDVRRAILKGLDITDNISTFFNKNPLFIEKSHLSSNEICSELVEKARDKQAHYIPVVDENKKVIHLCYYTDLNENTLSNDIEKKSKEFVLVVGGSGYLGSLLVKKLIDENYKVRVLDIGMFGHESLSEVSLNKNFELIKGDMRDITVLSKALKDIDVVVLLAGIVGDPASNTIPVDTIEINLLATMALAEACKYLQINRFIFASTCSVYGVGEDLLTEESPLRPVSLYARSKISTEETLMKLADENFAPTMLRMATLFGPSPRMRFDLVVNILTAKAIFDKQISIFGGNQWRPLLHVEDAAEAFMAVIRAPIERIKNQVFNVGSSRENYQIIEIGNMVKETFPGINMLVEKDDPDRRDYKVSFEKIKNVLGYEPKKSVKDGILEIKSMIEKGEIKNYSDKKYSNLLAVK